jgi:hypothetical protein
MPILPVAPVTTTTTGSSTSTLADLINDAYQEIGVLGAEDTLSAADQQYAVRRVKRILERLNLESLLIYATAEESFTLTAGQQTYTLGSGGDFDVVRPIAIKYANIRISNGAQPFERTLDARTDGQWADEAVKNPITPTIPSKIYADGANPLENVTIWPAPDQNYTLILWVWQQLAMPANLTDVMILPPGYEDLLVTELAIALCPGNGKQAPAELVARNREMKAVLKKKNTRPEPLRCAPEMGSTGGRYNIISDATR